MSQTTWLSIVGIALFAWCLIDNRRSMQRTAEPVRQTAQTLICEAVLPTLIATHPQRHTLEKLIKFSVLHARLNRSSPQTKAIANEVERLLQAVRGDDGKQDVEPVPAETLFHAICAALTQDQRDAIAEELRERSPSSGVAWTDKFAAIAESAAFSKQNKELQDLSRTVRHS